MGNIMAGLGLVLLGVILFQVADTFFLYPAQNEVDSRWKYYSLKIISFFLFGAGAVFIVLGYM